MDPLTIGVLVACGLGLLGVGHFSGSWAAKAKAAATKAITDVKADVAPVNDFLHHPVIAVEEGIAHHHANVVMAGMKDLWDDSSMNSRQEALNAERKVVVDLRNKVLAEAARLNPTVTITQP